MFKRPPLQFVGNKYRSRDMFIEQLEKFKNEDYIFIDLFGGSGYLSHITKKVHPENLVIYNDYDGYKDRVEKVQMTDTIISEIKGKFDAAGVTYGQKASRELSDEIALMLKAKEERGEYVDWMTLSSQLCYTNWICKSYDTMKGHHLHNKLHTRDIKTEGYFDGLNIVKDEWINIWNKYRENENVVWILDPPYPLCAQTQYIGGILMREVLAIIDIMFTAKHVIYFCSDTSGIEDIILWKYGNKLYDLYGKYKRINYAGGRVQKFYEDVMFVSKCR